VPLVIDCEQISLVNFRAPKFIRARIDLCFHSRASSRLVRSERRSVQRMEGGIECYRSWQDTVVYTTIREPL
jgi:hypothetical protein